MIFFGMSENIGVRERRKLVPFVLISLCTLCVGCMAFCPLATAGDPGGASYSANNDHIFWFLQISDIHMGQGSEQDSTNLSWIVTGEGKQTINPEFIVATGDLTESNLNSQDLDDWIEYNRVLGLCLNEACSQINLDVLQSYQDVYYDLPGNHDHYGDPNFDFYLNWSVQGLLSSEAAPIEERTQSSWLISKSYGTYHFIGANTAGDDGWTWPFDHAGLRGPNADGRPDELTYIQNEFTNNPSDLSFVFGHHPIRPHYTEPIDTGFEHGAEDFMMLLNDYGISQYAFGHTHKSVEAIFTEDLTWNGVFYLNVASLGKSDENHYNIIAIDNDGISTVSANYDEWPAVLITTPTDQELGGHNPYTYEVPSSSSNYIRALVFDTNVVSHVRYRIDGIGDWNPMSKVRQVGGPNSYLWETVEWDTTSLGSGCHVLEVQAIGSTTEADTIVFDIEGGSGVVTPSITANDTDDFLTLSPGDLLEVKVSLDPGDLAGEKSDWWIILAYYESNTDSFVPIFYDYFITPLFCLPRTVIVSKTDMPSAYWRLYLIVDTNPNFLLDTDQMFLDAVDVAIY
jgi:hypothetical protein